MGTVLYALACIVVPALWGFAMFYVFGFVDRRPRNMGSKASDSDLPPIDYSI